VISRPRGILYNFTVFGCSFFKKNLLNGAIMCASLALCLIMSEGVFRLLSNRPSFTEWSNRSLSYILDESVDWKLEPRRYDWGVVNDDNFRGPQIPYTKSPGVTRIAIIGGSGAFDVYKKDDSTWATYLAQNLTSRLKRPIEILNAGTPGYSSWQARNLLSSKVIRWKPDAVILYELFNDSLTFHRKDRQDIIRGWKINAQTNFISPSAHPGSWFDALPEILPYTTDAIRYLWVRVALTLQLKQHDSFWKNDSLTGEAQPVALEFYRDNRIAISRICAEAGGIPLIIVSQASIIQPNNSPEERATILYAYRNMNHPNLVRAYSQARAIDRQLAEILPSVEYLPAHEHIPPSLEYFFDEVHLNDRGSRLLANYIAEELTNRGILLGNPGGETGR
jgi:lysophospholipase L1-like esterase